MLGKIIAALVLFTAACSFNYDTVSEDNESPDLIMRYAEYVRIENGNPIFKVNADQVRRYEAKHSMELDNFAFDQYNSAPEDYEKIPDINVRGNVNKARIETDTNNLFMSGGVYLEVKSEDITLETGELSWQDQKRLLNALGKLSITRSDGTVMEGVGFSADVRKKSWEFESDVAGSIVDDDS
jgi:LPS export ABC transporter protein LptC